MGFVLLWKEEDVPLARLRCRTLASHPGLRSASPLLQSLDKLQAREGGCPDGEGVGGSPGSPLKPPQSSMRERPSTSGVSNSASMGGGHHSLEGLLFSWKLSLNCPPVMISRTLGPEFGGSIGLMFYLANVCACGVYVLGLVEAILDVFGAGGLPATEPRGRGGGESERGQLSVLFCSGRGCESPPEAPLSLLLLAQMDRSRRA